MSDRKFIKSFAGFRGLALLGVALYHLYPDVFVGGYLGVVIFFTMSGYLLMWKYLQESSSHAGEVLKRRFSKLMPPLIAMVAVTTIWTMFLGLKHLPWIRANAIGSIFGVNNIVQIAQGFSYFDSHGALVPFNHLWALSCEMQFYVLWALFTHGERTEKRTMNMTIVLLVLSLISAILMMIVYKPGIDNTRVYYGTDTRLFSFTIGALFGLIGTKGMGRGSQRRNGARALGVLVVLILGMLFLKEGAVLYYGGMLAYSLLTGLFLVYISKDDNGVARAFHHKSLQMLGKYSYGIYLWQYAIMILFREMFKNIAAPYVVQVILHLIVLVIFVVLTKVFIEDNRNPRRILAGLSVILVLILGVSFATQVKPAETEEQIKLREARELKAKREAEEKRRRELNLEDPEVDFEPDEEVKEHVKEINNKYPDYAITKAELEELQKIKGIMIGDSLTEMSEAEYAKLMPSIEFDGKVNRQLFMAIDPIQQKLANVEDDRPVIYQLGTNSDFNSKTLEELIEVTGDRKIIFVNIIAPDPWENSVNKKLADAAETHDNVYMVDFYELCKTKTELFTPDATHLQPSGQRLLGQMIARTLLDSLEK